LRENPGARKRSIVNWGGKKKITKKEPDRTGKTQKKKARWGARAKKEPRIPAGNQEK